MRHSYGILFQDQKEALRPFVEGREVHDLGAYNLVLSYELLKLGANSVIAVDKEAMPASNTDKVVTVRGYFKVIVSDPDVAFISWPANRVDQERDELLMRSRVIAYLGTNAGGTACGSKSMFRHMMSRELLAYVPHRKNTLIVVGPNFVDRKVTAEEHIAMSDGLLTYEEAIERYG